MAEATEAACSLWSAVLTHNNAGHNIEHAESSRVHNVQRTV